MSHTTAKEGTKSFSPIAVIGIAVNLPQSTSKEGLWDNLVNKKIAFGEFPEVRKEQIKDLLEATENPGFDICAFLEDISSFDASFFRISEIEAKQMSPMHRLFLEVAWKALEDAGYAGIYLSNRKIGVYAGCRGDSGSRSYLNLLQQGGISAIGATITGNVASMLPSRISYLLNLNGPAMAIDTSCSSSLVSIYTASRAIMNGDCDMALAGGINLTLVPLKNEYKIGFESSSHQTRPFDKDADGTQIGEGAGVVVLKALDKALEDGDNIYAVINGGSVNQDGRTSTITAPSLLAQEEVIENAWKSAGLKPSSMSYMEAHGTATELGDPIEWKALNNILKQYSNKTNVCPVGSIKANIGHLLESAGVIGFIKSVLVLHNRIVPPQASFVSLNSSIDAENSFTYVNKDSVTLPAQGILHAGISSFGMSGTNCHMVLSSFEDESKKIIEEEYLFTLSASSIERLRIEAKNHIEFLEKWPDTSMTSLCFTRNAGRVHLPFRMGVVIKSREELLGILHDFTNGNYNADQIHLSDSRVPPDMMDQLDLDEKASILVKKISKDPDSKDRSELLKLYVRNANIDWELFYRNKKHNRISIPGYEFEKLVYWPDSANGNENEDNQNVREKILGLLNKLAGIEKSEIADETELLDLGIDSLILFQIIDEIKKRYSVTIEIRDFFTRLTSFGKLIEHINKNYKYPDPSSQKNASLTITTQRVIREYDPQRFPFKPVLLNSGTLNEKQQNFLKQFINSYINRTKSSRAYVIKYREILSDWINSIDYQQLFKEITYPIVSSSSAGAYVTDVDGNKYIDLGIGYGAGFFGNSPQFIKEAISKQIEEGFELAFQSDLAGSTAKLVCELTGVDRVAFSNTGTEAIMAAMRIARAKTGKNKIVIFNGAYHGTFDGVLGIAADINEPEAYPLSPGITPGMVDDLLVLPFGLESSIQYIREYGSSIAAVIIEPVQSRRPGIQLPDFLKSLRKVTQEINSALIFDEIITGFRISTGGAQEYFGVRADIITYGKVVGGGMPIGLIAGKTEYLDLIDGGQWQYNDSSYPEVPTALYGGTFCKHPLTLSAMHAVLTKLKEEGDAIISGVNKKTAEMAAGLNAFFEQKGLPVKIAYFGSLFRFEFSRELDPVHNPCDVRLFFALLLYKGIYTWERRICFLSTEHSDQDIKKIVDTVKETIEEMQLNGFLLIQTQSEPEERDKFHLSNSQLRMWLNDLLTTDRNSVNLTFTYELDGKLDYEALQSAFRSIFSRHEMLRAVFFEEQDEPYQKIRPVSDINFELPLTDCSEYTIENTHQQIKMFLNEKFDLSSDLLLRASLFKLAENKHILALSSHHIVVDGWSVNLFMKELGLIYQCAKNGESENKLTPLNSTYREYVEQESDYLQTQEFSDSLEWWKRKIGTGFRELKFNSDNRSSGKSKNAKQGAFFRETLPDKTYSAVKAFSKQKKTTLFVTMLSLINALLHKLTGEKRVVIGTSVLGRNEERFLNTIGNYINTIPLISDFDDASNLTSIASSLQNNLFEAFEHQRVPLNEIVKIAKLKEKSKLFNVVVQVESKSMSYYDITANIFDGLASRPYNLQADAAEQDLYIEFCESADKLDIKIEYNLDVFSRQWIEELFQAFLVLSNEILSNPLMKISESRTAPENASANNPKPFKAKDIHYKTISGIPYELSPAQRRLWILSQFGDGSAAYNMVGAFEIEGELNVDYLEGSLRQIIKRHKSLNTIFAKDVNGDIKQYVMDDQSVNFEVERIGTAERPYNGKINSILDKEAFGTFDLSIWPLIKVKLVYTGDDKYTLIFTLHHIICDGWSVNVILKELQYYYNGFLEGTPKELPPLSQQYYHYSTMINDKLSRGEYENAAKFWKAQFNTEVKPIELPSVKRRPERMSYNVEIIRYNINEKHTKELKQLAKNNKATLFPVLLAIVDSFLYKYSGSTDIVLGTPVAGRSSIELENQIGHYLNTIALRCQLSETDTFSDIISKRKQGTLNAFKYGDYPFDQLLTELNLKRDLSRSPLFDIMVVLQNADSDTSLDEFNVLGNKKIKRIQYDQSKSLFDLCFTFEENKECIALELECNTDVFDEYRISMFKVHFDVLLLQVLENPGRLIREISLLSPEERNIIDKLNNTERPVNTQDSIIKRLKENAKTLGNTPSVYSANTVVSWNELQNRVGFISEWIVKTAGIKKGEKVGVFINRDEWLPVTLLAILDAGAIYVPIDVNYPKSYINHIIEESDLRITICDATAFRVISGIANGVLLTDILSGYNHLKTYDLIAAPLSEADVAAILFTSGSTGKPKGVRVLHKGIHSLLAWAEEEYKQSQIGVVYALTSISFDLSIYELFFPIWIGKPLRVLSGALEMPENMTIDKNILLNTVPSIIERFIKEDFNFSNITVLNVAGEMVPAYFKEQLDYKRIEVRNLYGPTEYSVYSTVYLFEDNTNGIKIGKPLNNTKVYLLDEQQTQVPVGFIGELYLAGQGLAGGYENDEERTKKAFVINPFDNGNYETMYRTGDFARLLPDGQLDLIGRQDNQTKIQGYRVELIEIENALNEFPGVEKSVVTIVNSTELSEKKLLAYIKKKQSPGKEELKDHVEHEIYENKVSLDENTKALLLHEFNSPGYEYNLDEDVVTKFESIAKKYPDKVAVKFNERILSYGELNKKANKIARSILKKKAIKQDDIIVILMERSEIMIATILGIWKAGAAYLPIDPKYPIERIKGLVADSKTKMILVENDSVWKDLINVAGCEIFSANLFSNDLSSVDTNPGIFIPLSSLAYVIYTSGSTGKPKGVMIEHLGMLNHIIAKTTELGINANSAVAQNATHCFDISIWQMFAGLISGGKTIVYSYETILDPEVFLKELKVDKVSVLELVPSYFVEMLAIMEDAPNQKFLDNLSIIVLNAETLIPDLVKRWFDSYPNCPIVNTYGATEVSDDTSHYIMYELPATATIPVMKRPIANFRIYIVGQNMELVPIGEIGEILISGPCVGRGYLNDEERTKAVFIDDPFRSGTRAYRTGDLGRYLNDGTMEFIGRKDSQVKVSGHRVELGEIQHAIVSIEQINEAIVVAVPDSQKKNTVCAYYTLLKGKLIDEIEIKKELQKTLPDYMVPSYFHRMEKFPLNENGKVDKKKLPDLLLNDSNKDFIEELRINISRKLPFYMQPSYYVMLENFPMTPNGKIDRKGLANPEGILLTGPETYISPRTREEKELLEIWKKLLNTDKIGIQTNFFDIGGNSLKLIGLFKQINKNFPNTFRVPDLFEFATIEKQAKKIEQVNGKNTADMLEEVEF